MPATADSSRIRITADPRIELLAVVQSLTDYRDPAGRPILTRFDFPYRQEVQRRFAPWADHPAAQRFAAMSRRGFWLGHPPRAVLSFGEPPGLASGRPLDDFTVERAGGQEPLDEFVGLLRHFAEDADFMAFYGEQRAFYDSMTARYARTVSGFHYVEDLEAYYGRRQASYTVILAPLFHAGGFGPRVERSPGFYDVYNISGPYDVDADGVPTFGPPEELRRIVWHEFGHSFVNHLVEAELDRFRGPCSVLCAELHQEAAAARESMDTLIHEWVSEHIVRAVTTRLAYRELGRAEGDAALEVEHRSGYACVGELAAALERYEQQRDEYPDLASYLPELAAVFERAAER